MQLTNFQTSLKNASWIDVNPNFTKNANPDRLPDAQAILQCSLYNLFSCPIGARGRIFQPEYGSSLINFIQEPISDVVASQIQIALIHAIQRWEPRVVIDYSNSFVKPDYNLPGYRVRLTAAITATGAIESTEFSIMN